MNNEPSDPEFFLRAFVGSLDESIGGVSTLLDEIKRRQSELIDLNEPMVRDHQSRTHLAMTTLTLAGYQVLKEAGHKGEDLLDPLKAALRAPYRGRITSADYWFLGAADPVQVMIDAAKNKEAFYGETFAFEYEVQPGFSASNVNRCFYHDFFTRNGAPELTAVFCDWDRLWSDQIDPERHGVRFERPTTLGSGGDRCRFQFHRVSKTGG